MAVSSAAAPMARWSQLRMRRSAHLRDLCAETPFTLAHFVQPIFVVEGLEGTEPIPGLDGNARLSLDAALDVIAADVAAGVRHFLLFAVPSHAGMAGYGAFRIPNGHAERFAPFFHAAIARGVYLPPSPHEVGFLSLAHDADTLASGAWALIAAAREADPA